MNHIITFEGFSSEIIREINLSDIPSVVGLINRAIEYNFKGILSDRMIQNYIFDYSEKRLENKIKSDKYYVCVLISENQVVGTGTIEKKNQNITGLYLDPEYQSKGFGMKILNHLIEKSREFGFGEVHLQATDVSVQFYRKFGFEDMYKKFCFKNDPKSAYYEMVYHLMGQ
jgi:GNAT superfamily N-acetyltransferase